VGETSHLEGGVIGGTGSEHWVEVAANGGFTEPDVANDRKPGRKRRRM
jgi:hypothetical protein